MAKRKIKRVIAGLPAGVSSGSQLIRDQIAKGNDKPSAIIAAIKAEAGVDISAALVNSVKMGLKKKAGKLPKALRTPKAKAKGDRVGNGKTAKAGGTVGNANAPAGWGMGNSKSAVEIAIRLTEKFGADQAREIISVLGSASHG